MVIIPELQAVFIHIPKTGGHALGRAFGKRYPRTRVKYHADSRHPNVWEVAKELGANGWYYFSVIRNPWERLQSMFTWCQRVASDKEIRTSLPVTDPAVGWATRMVDMGFDAAIKEIVGTVSSGGAWPTFCNDKVEPFLFEEDFFKQISARFKIEDLDDERTNESTHEKPPFTQEAIDLIARHCWYDIKRFGYQPPEQ